MTGDVVYTADDLAQMLRTNRLQVLEWRRQYGWPSFKIGREVRFTRLDVEQIIASHSTKARADLPAVALSGQTSRSARRSA